jgi:hypothetical protein
MTDLKYNKILVSSIKTPFSKTAMEIPEKKKNLACNSIGSIYGEFKQKSRLSARFLFKNYTSDLLWDAAPLGLNLLVSRSVTFIPDHARSGSGIFLKLSLK